MKMIRIFQLTFLAVACFANIALAQVSPIAATGWNHDFVLNGAGPYDTAVTGTMDGGLSTIENWVWVEKGTYTNPDGNPQDYEGLVAGTHASLTGNGTFAFQSFTGNNVVALDAGQSGTLTLSTPAAYTSIALFGASGFGAKTATVTLNFADTTSAAFNVASGTGIGTDWFNSNPDKAFEAKGRASNKSEEGYTRLFYQQNDVIGINESLFTLAAGDQAKLLSSVTIQNTGGDRMAVFAISGAAVPEPSAAALCAAWLLALLRRRRVS
jgi:hypothetical protein